MLVHVGAGMPGVMLVNANINAPRSVIVRPPRTHLRIESKAPTWQMNPTLFPPKAALALTTYVPTITTGILVAKQDIVITTYAPTVTNSLLTQDVVGLVQEDDFNRADSDTVGTGWNELEGDFDIVSNRLQAQVVNRALVENTTRAKAIEWFFQSTMRWTGTGEHAQIGVLDYQASSEDGYGLLLQDDAGNIQLQKYVNGTRSDLGSPTSEAMSTNTDYPKCQLYVKAGVQEGYFQGDGAGATVSAADTTHDAQLKAPVFIRWTGSISHTQRYEECVICVSKNIIVRNLPTGWKAKVRNAADAVVASATESGGIATIDASLFGSATERMPLGGWPTLQITDGADVEQGRWDLGSIGFVGVYPGDEYTKNL